MRRRLTSALVFALNAAAMPAAAQSADSAWARRDLANARRLYHARLAADSLDTTALFRLALLETWTGHAARSLEYLDRLLRIAPQDLDAQAARARALAANGQFERGLAVADAMATNNPANVTALQTRARFAFWNGDVALADVLAERALLADPDNVETRILWSQTLRRQGRFDEAWDAIAPARARAPADADVRNEADRVAQSLRPRLRSSAGFEADSDENAILTWTLSGASALDRGLQLRADTYVRDASVEGASRTVTARGALATASLLAHGWQIETSLGASASAGQAALAAAGVRLVTPRRTRAVATFSVTRTPWDYTAPMAENQVVVDEAGLVVDWKQGRLWSLQLTGGIAKFDVRRQALANRRWSAQGQLLHAFSDRVSLGLGARAFGFDRDLNGGYFDPDFYGLADARVALRLGTGRWMLDADIAPGVQRAGRGADAQAALHAAADLGFEVRPGRRIGLRAIWANTGLNQLSPGARTSYHYTAATLTLGWWF